jgi:hypothetical protein
MYPFLSYILKVSLSLAAFYLFYKLLCSRDTWHRANRCLLLSILALSAAVPFMHIDLNAINAETSVIVEELGMALLTDPVADEAILTGEPTLWQRIPWQQIPWQQIPWHTVLASIYLTGLAVYLIKFIGGLASIAQLIRHSKRREMADGILLVTHTKDYSPFSWMRYIIVSEHDIQENYDMILAHERAHIQRGHSWDLLFAQLCATAQWFNPAAWLLKRELEAIHEYEAHGAVLGHEHGTGLDGDGDSLITDKAIIEPEQECAIHCGFGIGVGTVTGLQHIGFPGICTVYSDSTACKSYIGNTPYTKAAVNNNFTAAHIKEALEKSYACTIVS